MVDGSCRTVKPTGTEGKKEGWSGLSSEEVGADMQAQLEARRSHLRPLELKKRPLMWLVSAYSSLKQEQRGSVRHQAS